MPDSPNISLADSMAILESLAARGKTRPRPTMRKPDARKRRRQSAKQARKVNR